MTVSSPELAVVLGTYNRLEQLQRCVASILTETKAPFRLYITDAGSTDGTVEYLSSLDDERIEPILVGAKLGQARAYNDVFRILQTPYVCWLSDDNVVVNRGLDAAYAILRGDDRIGMVGLKVKDVRGRFASVAYIGGLSIIGILNVNQGMLPTPLLQRLGGFDEDFRDYGIDPDLTAKVLLQGCKVVYTRQICIHHERNWSTDPRSAEYAHLKQRHEHFKRRYAERYASLLPPKPSYLAKRYLWKVARIFAGQHLDINSARSAFGVPVRDWHNAMAGRYISALDPWRTRGRDYHLVQVLPESEVRRLREERRLDGLFKESLRA
jgi:GT2 family glycosyltransferase